MKSNSLEFLGWKSEDGLLEVVGIHGKQRSITTFKVICHKCKDDKELFPDGYFISNKGNLVRGKKPCGCAFNPKWTKEQFLVLARRVAQGRFIVHGFSEEFHGQTTKLNLECLIDGYRWSASVDSIINSGNGCSKCSNNYKPTEQEAFDTCKAICEIEGYEPIGLPNGYKNNMSRFEYKCPIHGIQNVSYHNFITNGRRCRRCWRERQKEIIRENGNGNGYYPERKDEKDFLYVLSFNNKFIKVGRSFDVGGRLKGLRSLSKVPIKKIHKLRIFTATHQEIYNTEQSILKELREEGFQYYVDWSKECFENDCLYSLNKMLDICSLTEVKIKEETNDYT